MKAIILLLVFCSSAFCQSTNRDLFTDSEIVFGKNVDDTRADLKAAGISLNYTKPGYMQLEKLWREDGYWYRNGEQTESKSAKKSYFFKEGKCDSIVFSQVFDTKAKELLNNKYVFIKQDTVVGKSVDKIRTLYKSDRFNVTHYFVIDKTRDPLPSQVTIIFTD